MSQAGAAPKLRVGYLTISVNFAPLYVAQEAGFFAKNGLDVELVFIRPRILTQALLAGNIAMGVAGPVEVEATVKGADFVLLATYSKVPALGYLITRKTITKTEQLKGKKLGISRLGAAPHRILELALKKVGLDPRRDVVIVQAGETADRVASVKAGNIDGTLGSVDAAYAAQKLDLNVLLELKNLGVDYLTSTVVTKRSFVKKNKDTVRRFMKATVEAIHFYKTRKKESLKILAKYFKGQDPEVVEFGYNRAAQDSQRKPYVRTAGVQAVLDSIARRNPRAKEFRPEQFIDASFVKELDESGFIDNLYK